MLKRQTIKKKNISQGKRPHQLNIIMLVIQNSLIFVFENMPRKDVILNRKTFGHGKRCHQHEPIQLSNFDDLSLIDKKNL